MRKLLSTGLATILLLAVSGRVQAASTYQEYTYSVTGDAVPSPKTYNPHQETDTLKQTGLRLSEPADLAHDAAGNLWILDAGNNRLVVLNPDLSLLAVIDAPVIDGETVSLEGCTGLFIDNKGDVYLADKIGGFIYVLDAAGVGQRIVRFQPLPVLGDDFIFKPTRLTVDAAGIIQVACEGCYQGLITMAPDGRMIGYFGANKVQASLSILATQFWRNIFSQEQLSNIKQIIPVEYSSLAMDRDGFVYTSTAKNETSTFELKKLNPSGDNVLRYNEKAGGVKIGDGNYGDLRIIYDNSTNVDTVFQDIFVDADGFIFALDAQRGRIFQYDQDSTLVSINGGIGEQKGTFLAPVAVSVWDGCIYVLDRLKNKVTVFQPTDYVCNIRAALIHNQRSEYLEALPYWEKVYKANVNYQVALTGIGKAAYRNGNLKGAMNYFKQAEDRRNYDVVYTAYRTQFVRDKFLFFGLGAVGLVFLVLLGLRRSKRRGGEDETAIT